MAKRWVCENNGNDENLSKIDALVFMVGNDDDASQYSKSNALQRCLFLASSRKALFFQPVENEEYNGSVPPVIVLTREKSDKDKANFTKLAEKLKEVGSSFGYFAKDSYSSDFAKGWSNIIEEYDIKLTVDVSASFAHLLSVKEDIEIELCRKAAQASVNAWSHARKKIIDIIDQAKKVKHSRFAEDLERAMTTVQVQQRLADNNNLESCYTPIIQSGGDYTLKLSAESNDKLMHYGTIICSLGARYQSYCSNLSRTMLVDPSKELQEAYESLLIIQNAIIGALKPGKKLNEVYAAGLEAAKDKPIILDRLFLTGLEFRESTVLISPRSDVEVVPNMVFIVYVGLQGLENLAAKDEQSKTSAVLLSDTVLEGVNEVLTEKAKSRIKSNVIRFKDEAETSHADDNKENNLGEGLGRGKRSVLLQEQTRNKTTNEDKRKEHQKELGKRLNEAARERLADQTGQKDIKKIKKSNISYKSYEKFPKEAEIDKLQIYVDRRHDSVILPIFGVPVPFHISMIKNTSQSVEGDYTYLRVNFMHPGSQIGRDQLQFPNPLSTYVKELTYRSSNLKEHGEVVAPSSNLSTAYRLIKEMQKKFRTQEAEEREKEGAVKQDKLILSTAKGNPKLKDLFVRPNIITKRISGSLEAHANGFRYTSLRGDKIDVLYNNIKHAFFQPCDNEMIILIHFTLKNPVLWGKRKYQDIQFYTEVGEITTDLGKYHHMQDRDDVQSEQLEREMRKRLNQVFQNFCDKVVRQTNEAFDFDVPFNELGFFGVPYRSSCTLKPTSSCLVNLSEWPPFVVTLDEVEFVHFERIPMTSLDSVKEWLNSCDIYYSEGIQSLNWAKIMKTILDDPEDFFVNGGWNFLATDSDNEDEEEDEESEDAYTPSEDETEGSDEDEDEEESPEATSESESEASMDSDESEGKDWSDLEAEAQRADRARDRGEEERMHKSAQKRKPSSKGRVPSPKRRK
ncbi:FACT complex subunit SPT16 [Dirofilaria immitis]|nr:FACT complex subunit SPT16 [Dirofilaria immitis]